MGWFAPKIYWDNSDFLIFKKKKNFWGWVFIFFELIILIADAEYY